MMDVEKTKEQLQEVGFCLVKQVMSANEAEHMAARCFELH